MEQLNTSAEIRCVGYPQVPTTKQAGGEENWLLYAHAQILGWLLLGFWTPQFFFRFEFARAYALLYPISGTQLQILCAFSMSSSSGPWTNAGLYIKVATKDLYTPRLTAPKRPKLLFIAFVEWGTFFSWTLPAHLLPS